MTYNQIVKAVEVCHQTCGQIGEIKNEFDNITIKYDYWIASTDHSDFFEDEDLTLKLTIIKEDEVVFKMFGLADRVWDSLAGACI